MQVLKDLGNYAIKQVTTMKEIHSIFELQKRAWNFGDDEAVATFEMKAVTDFGTVLMAYVKDKPNEAIGFIYAFPNFDEQHYKHYSHMMAVDPLWQGNDIGYQLKMVHRDIALASKPQIYSIEWTVDPLLPNNALLNFGKLGCICNTYKDNFYGAPDAVGIYSGLPTDRLLVEWELKNNRVINKLSQHVRGKYESYEQLIEQQKICNVGPEISTNFEAEKTFLAEVPANFQHLRKHETETALKWRLFFRELCTTYFSRGWYLVDYIRTRDVENNSHNFYKFSTNI